MLPDAQNGVTKRAIDSDVWYALKDASKYVYHYTSPSALIDFLLPTMRIRFSRFAQCNDPRESRDWTFDFLYNESHTDGYRIDVAEKFNAVLKRNCRVGCFVRDVESAVVSRERELAGENIDDAPFERGHSRPRMWAQYAKDHKGACLVFLKDRLATAVESAARAVGAGLFEGEVEYRHPRHKFSFTKPSCTTVLLDRVRQLGYARAVEEHVGVHYEELFFSKPTDWQQEREYRWLAILRNEKDFYVDIREALVGVLLGQDFQDAEPSILAPFSKAETFSVAKMEWRNGLPQPNSFIPHFRV